ncbi:PREDICTED: uncharacterized protein LOC108363277 [Rhagoletis zephyria]|uniref:uncharacterized protein LOC108363277 n=1 Tax=Rhagoletis zephyria TaxID=28612 RepID=UPI0008115DB8|nr:PREDICTED: uncharacterized protein LOC108363277 [Rhagoletis zephyria]
MRSFSTQRLAFDSHFQNIANAISVEKSSSVLVKDFELIRVYLMEILRNDPIIGPLLVSLRYKASAFDYSIILDFSKFMPLGVIRTKYPSFIKIAQRGRCSVFGTQDLPFFSNGEYVAGGIVTNIVKGLIAQGLDLGGYFVRGHMGDIYELELIEETINLDYRVNLGCNNEWQSNYISLSASTEGITIKIRFRVLLKFCAPDKPNDLTPYPMHNLKLVWLASADVRYLDYFSLCAPMSESQLAASPKHLMAMRLLYSLIEHNKLHTLRKTHVESICYEIIYTKIQKRFGKRVATALLEIVHNSFTIVDKTANGKIVVQMAVFRQEILDQIRSMRQNDEISYEEVACLFGVQLNTDVYNVDDFGIYRHFNKPT